MHYQQELQNSGEYAWRQDWGKQDYIKMLYAVVVTDGIVYESVNYLTFEDVHQ